MPSYPRSAHRVSGGRNYRRVIGAVQQNNDTGTGTGSSGAGDTASYWVLEEDGTSKWLLEEGTYFWITEEST